MSEFLAELIGTMILIIFGGGVVGGVVLKQTKAEGAGWVVITIGWGLAVAMGVYAVGNFSGAHINPAVTLGFAAIGEFPWSKVPLYITAQMIGAIIGAVIVFLNYLPHWKETKDQGAKLGVFATDPAIRSPFSNLLSEIVGTFVLVMGLLFIGANEFTEGLNPIIVGALIIAIGMSLGGATGYAINPARDLGPRIAHALLPIPGKGGSDWGYSWIPVLGPIIGGIYGALFYNAFFTGSFSTGFWIMSVMMAVIIIGAVSAELKKKETLADKMENKAI
ncbi:MAG: MIP/aquaporin family protein [Bacillota bacterium]|uniref:Aquaporin family protein n=1 Tax=Virgibacillus salarius TaxID=447199 RepID=A0A941DW95_9BACI|nr:MULTISPECIES: MIP/aquaporin family protein [Bacillaceae]NAZ09576.1 MIP family channel protein [Agaribacter marinus]MBR7796866.1 aquaporin family protein [Virgibacillus salarius]MCC2249989.1 aquaporin family protein [Virgibacillus sp. AGTR]MDY7044673.1 MIP/aquaporin family protein [Virgibacillus sp. M23]QRZ18157.1 aquaporin family protein [Virgibacillus sp. AGTR]